jgi:tetratricopeptide (TPR) repeat protein
MSRFRYYFRRSLYVLLAGVVLAAPFAWWWITSRPEYRLKRALEAVERDDLQTAERAALQFEADGYKDYAHLLRGKMLLHEENFPAALAQLDQIEDKGNLRLEATIIVGRCYLGLRDPFQAERSFKFVSNEKPDHVEAHKGLATAYFQQGAYVRAIQHAEQWAKLTPRDGKPHRFIGFFYRDLEMCEQAIPAYQEALKRDLAAHVAEEVRLELAECQIKRGEWEDALETLAQSEPPAGAAARKLTLEAECARALARTEEARETADRALRVNAKFVPALRLRAAMHLDDGEPAKAADLLERAIAIDPHDLAARDRLAQAYLGLGKKEQAESQRRQLQEMQKLFADMDKINQQLRTRPRDAALHNHLANILERLNRPQDAAQERRIANLLGGAESKSGDSKSGEKK